MTEVRELNVPGRYASIPAITHFVSEAAEAAGLSEKENYHCQMSVDEACTNVIEHAYGGEDVGAILITCRIDPGRCEIIVVDNGDPFDPSAVPEPTISPDPTKMRSGGLGLHLMRHLMDEVSFTFSEGENRLRMVKQHVADDSLVGQEMITTQRMEGGVVRVALAGRLNSAVAPEVEGALLELIETGRPWLIIDMQAVEYISSRTLKAFVTAWKAAGAAGGSVVLAGLMPQVFEVFETVGFTQIIDVHGSVALALAAIGRKMDHR